MKLHKFGIGILATLVATSVFADREVTREIHASAPAAGVRKVIIEIPIAEITVVSAITDTISVRGQVRREYDDTEEMQRAEKLLESSDVEISVKNGRAVVRRKFGRDRRGRSARSSRTMYRVKVTLPTGTDLEVMQRIGELDINGEFGDIKVAMSIGDISVRVPKRNVKEISARALIGEVRTDLGDRVVTAEGFFPGKTHYLNEGGASILDVRLRIGDIELDLTDQ